MARVASDGPFSDFAGVDRTLAVVKGNGLVLTTGENAPVTLVKRSGPGQLSRRHADVRAADGGRDHRSQCDDDDAAASATGYCASRNQMSCDFGNDDIAVVLSLDGTTMVTCGQDSTTLDHGEAAVFSRTTMIGFRILPTTSHCYLVWLTKHRE